MHRIFEHLKKNWLAYLVAAIYAVLLALIISKHEPWFDEAQSWLLARDNSLATLLTKYIRYEGSPPLWQLTLMIPAKLGLPYYTLKIVSGIIAVAAVYVFVCRSPFPSYVKILFPFSFFLFYQYGVVARSYVLLTLLLFLIASIYDRKMEKIFTFTILACLLANVSVHGFVIAIVLFGIHLLDLKKAWPNLDKTSRRKQLYSILAFAVVSLLIVLIIFPPSDLTFASFKDPNIFSSARSRMKWNMLNTSLTGIAFLSIPILLLSCMWFWRRRVLLLFLTLTMAMLALFLFAYANVWHEGILMLIWIFTMWISFQGRDERSTWSDRVPSRVLRPVIIGTLIVVALIQIYWSFNNSRFDWSHNYSASREIAEYIKENNMKEDTIYATSFHSISILPYFQHNIFDNYNGKENPSFWQWSTKNNMIESLDLILIDRPEWIILGVKFPSQEILPDIEGYDLVRFFDGALYWKDHIFEKDAFALYHRTDI